MDNSIPPVTAPVVPVHAVPSGKPTAAATAAAPQPASPAVFSTDTVELSPQAQPQIAIVQEAALFKNDYAVSDKEFSIFKDANGTYITRYVSERDGSVTYEPAAPVLVRDPSPNIAISV